MSRSLSCARRLAALAALAFALAASGCAAPRSSVILLPDDDGHVGAVVVSGGGVDQRVDKAYDEVVVAKGHPATPPSARGKVVVDDAYADLLKAQPTRPRTFVVNFLLDSIVMTEASKAHIPEMIAAAHSRQPTEVTVYGHADASGTESHNDRLSAERARVVAELLRKADPSLDHIEMRACGDRVPLVAGNAHAPEPRNRRAEVVIL